MLPFLATNWRQFVAAFRQLLSPVWTDYYRAFEVISDYCDQFSAMIPVGFVLGFFVTMIVGRWWDEFNTIPWPANVALLVSANVQVQLLKKH